MKKILSLNLALIILLSLVCISTPAASASDAQQLIVNGVSYDYTKNQKGDGWEYNCDAQPGQSGLLTLRNYNGGAIFAPCNLSLYFSGTNVITAKDSAGIIVTGNLHTYSLPGSKLNDTLSVTGTIGYPAIRATGTIDVLSVIEVQGGGVAAFSATQINFYNGFCDTFVGLSSSDCKKGNYNDQYYFKRANVILSLKLYGNGGKTDLNEDSVTEEITKPTSANCSLYPYSNTFKKNNATLLGWTTNPDGTGDYWATDSVYKFVSSEYKDSLYALWDDSASKGIVLKDYCDKNCDVHDKVIRCAKGSKYTLPIAENPGTTFGGWIGADSNLYPAGTEINVDDTVTYTAKYTALKLVIDGKEYDASKLSGSSTIGWSYYPPHMTDSAQIDLYSNYSGSPIDVPCDVRINLHKSLTGTEGKPAINVNGNVQIFVSESTKFEETEKTVVLQGGSGSAGVVATGNFEIEVYNPSQENQLVISSGDAKTAALSVGGKIITRDPVFFTGTDQNNTSLVGKYSGEKYIRIIDSWNYFIKLKGNAIVPSLPDSDLYTFAGWSSKPRYSGQSSIWYLPGDQIDAADGITLYALFLDNNRANFAVVIDGNGGTTSSGSKYYVNYASADELSLYKLPTTDLSKPGYTLSGYNSNSAGTGISYSKGASLPDDNKTLIYKLYAQWTQDSPGGSSGSGGSGVSGGGATTETPKVSSSTAEVTSKTEGSSSTAKVSADLMNSTIDYAFEQAKKNSSAASVTVSVEAPKDTKKVVAGIPTESIKKLGDARTDTGLTFTTPIGSITFDNSAIETIGANAQGEDTSISIGKVEKTSLTSEQQTLVGDRPVIDLTIESNGKNISSLGGEATVSVPYTPAQGEDLNNLVVWYLADDGSLSAMPCTYANGVLTFKTTHFSKYVLASVPLNDINANDWFYKSAVYAYNKGLMKGTSANKFDSSATATRGMIVTMLYRNASEPAITADDSFVDVNADAYYANAVKWANEKGIVKGVSESKFEPDNFITREQLVSILYRCAGSPAVGNVDMGKFSDAGKISSYANSAFAWAIQNAVIKGDTNGNLNPAGKASRAEVATMLMNYFSVIK